MPEQSQNLEIAIYRRNPEACWNVNEVEVGSLLNELTEEPFHLAAVGEYGTIKLAVQRTHEWEIVIALALTGSGIFLTGALTELGKRFGGWLADRIGKLGTIPNPEVRVPGLATVVVDPSDLINASDAISKLVSDAAQKGVPVQLIVEPGP